MSTALGLKPSLFNSDGAMLTMDAVTCQHQSATTFIKFENIKFCYFVMMEG
jgi:hypothetical protein